MKKIQIFDSTLRDGAQQEGVPGTEAAVPAGIDD